MVRVSEDPGGRRSAESDASGAAFRSKGKDPAVKLEVQDELEEEGCAPARKRSRPSAPPFQQEFQQQQQWSNAAAGDVSSQPSQYNPLNEPSPLGLRLRKSPSLLDLIQMKLSQGNATTLCGVVGGSLEPSKKKDGRAASVSGPSDKLKASNFPASLLKIGTWERISTYEGDLVAKCYYAKHKLVWEVLEGGLKSKIEIQWSDITALKASCPDNGPGTLDVVLARQPLFFRETNPQPRKHTLWQATSDFTGGQASIHRRHFLQCPQGLLSKHFEKLIQCDPRLNSLSRQPDIVLESPYFEPRCSLFDDSEETKCHGFDDMKNDYGPTFSGFLEASPTCSALSTSSKSDIKDPIGRTPESALRDTPSPSSGMDTRITDENFNWRAEDLKDTSRWDQIQVPGLHPSMSMSDLVNHIGNCITEQRTSGNPIFTDTSLSNKDILEEITQYLLGDSQLSAASDENSLMSRVNSLCCLLQKDSPTIQSRQKIKDDPDGGDHEEGKAGPSRERKSVLEFATFEGNSNDVSPRRQPPAMSRKESVGDLLLHLPRIASLPQFLFNISEESETRAR